MDLNFRNMKNVARVGVIGALLGVCTLVSAKQAGAASQVVINEVYGGGGNASAPYQNDFIELYNNGATSVTLSNYAVQYATNTGGSWSVTPLPPTVTIPAGGYYLIKEASGGTAGSTFTGDVNNGTLSISATTGKIALTSSTTPLTTTASSGGTIVDFVGFGTATTFEGSAAAPAPSNTTSIFRTNGVDTDKNSVDFKSGAPTPQSSSVGTLQFSASNYSVNEGNGTIQISVTRTGGASTAVSATYSTSNGTATAPDDFTAITSGSVSFAPGEVGTKTFTVAIIDDATVEPSETFTVNLTSSTLGTPSSATVTIVDNDVANTPPVATNDPSYVTTEDTALTVSTATGILANDTDAESDPLTVADADASTPGIQPANAPTKGTLTLNANGSFTYTPNANTNGTDTFTYRAFDGKATSNLATVTINVTPVNDAPVNTVPGTQSATPTKPLIFSTAKGNAISVADVDAGSGAIQVTLTTSNGTLTTNTASAATVTGNGTGSIVITGSLTDVNTALNGLSFTAQVGFKGQATLQVSSNDQGNTGGSAQTDTDTVVINVTVPSTTLVISEIYGGGGNANAMYNRDYIELHNTSSTPISLSGYAVQYASATNTNSVWQVTALPNGAVVPANGYYLIGEASGGSNGSTLAVDFNGNINLGAGTGKVALTNTTTALVGTVSGGAGSNIIDFVGYGTANAYEGSSPSPAPSVTNSISRVGTDTNENGVDFTSGTPTPALNTAVSTSGVIISEFRLSGPSSTTDEFVELQNNTSNPVNVSGWTLDAGGTTVPLSGTIPDRGHLLIAGTTYSLGSYASGDITLPAGTDIPLTATLTLKNSSGTSVDVVNGSGQLVPVTSTSQYSFVRRMEAGTPTDSGNDVNDFNLVDINKNTTNSDTTGVATLDTNARLGAPGPQNLTSAIQRNIRVTFANLASSPTVKYASSGSALDPQGQLSLRRTITNNSGGTVTKLRFRIAAITAGTSPVGTAADIRALSSSGVTVNGQPVLGLTLEAPSSPTGTPSSGGNGGGLNSSWIAVLPQGGLPVGGSVNVEFLFGIVKGGSYRVLIDSELVQ